MSADKVCKPGGPNPAKRQVQSCSWKLLPSQGGGQCDRTSCVHYISDSFWKKKYISRLSLHKCQAAWGDKNPIIGLRSSKPCCNTSGLSFSAKRITFSSNPFNILLLLLLLPIFYRKVYTPKRWRNSHCHLFLSPICIFNKIIIIWNMRVCWKNSLATLLTNFLVMEYTSKQILRHFECFSQNYVAAKTD